MQRNWFWVAALSLGLTAALAGNVFAKEKADYDDQVKWKDLPDPVKTTIDKERGKHDIVKLWHVRKDGREFYRAQIDTKGEDTSIRVSPEGKLITAEEVKETPAKVGTGVKKHVLPKDVAEGDEVEFDRLPGNVKTEIGRLARSNKVHEVLKYQHRGDTWYRAEVGEGARMYYIRVPANVDSNIHGVASRSVEHGERVAFDRLPGDVKTKIGALAKSGKVDEVTMYDHGGHKTYEALIDAKTGPDYVVTVDEKGKEIDTK